ncbi:MAG: hypothetical protein BGN93_02085 [Acinetobacter sp. 39-4]|nr:MAG: hypothetical protein BGN93_02085 [Acinetobacter sp. 39-4]
MSWTLAGIVESSENAPAGITFGKTPEEVIANHADGRFSLDRAEPIYSMASVWRAMIIPASHP